MNLQEILEIIFRNRIKQIGIAEFKKTSFFGSNRKNTP